MIVKYNNYFYTFSPSLDEIEDLPEFLTKNYTYKNNQFSPKELTTTVPDNYVLKGDSIGSYTAKNTAEGQQVYLSNDLYFNSDGTLCDISLNSPSIFQSQIQDDNNLLINVGMFADSDNIPILKKGDVIEYTGGSITLKLFFVFDWDYKNSLITLLSY